MTIIKDGTGTGNTTKVSGNRMFVHTITEGEEIHATENGDSYNLNTGNIGLTSQTESAILYFKNNESRDFIIDAIAIGVDSSGTTGNDSLVTLVRNPTSASFSTAVDMNQNRNFGSSKTLTADVYKGAEAATLTGGNDIAQFYMDAGSRLFAGINFVLTKGDSLGIKIDTDTTAGTTNVYAALIGHLKNADFID
jgi:hypothetical protein